MVWVTEFDLRVGVPALVGATAVTFFGLQRPWTFFCAWDLTVSATPGAPKPKRQFSNLPNCPCFRNRRPTAKQNKNHGKTHPFLRMPTASTFWSTQLNKYIYCFDSCRTMGENPTPTLPGTVDSWGKLRNVGNQTLGKWMDMLFKRKNHMCLEIPQWYHGYTWENEWKRLFKIGCRGDHESVCEFNNLLCICRYISSMAHLVTDDWFCKTWIFRCV